MRSLQQIRRRIDSSAPAAWYSELPERDQFMLRLLAGFLGIVAIWWFLWVPVQDDLSVARARHAAELSDYQWMIENHERALEAARGGQEGTAGSQALLTRIAASARRANLELDRFQPDASGGLTVSLDDVAFSELIQWMSSIEQREGVRIRRANLDLRAAGRVRARLVLQ